MSVSSAAVLLLLRSVNRGDRKLELLAQGQVRFQNCAGARRCIERFACLHAH